MPFRQPESTIIEANSVRSGGFSFRVEASLVPGQDGSKLAVDASEGYLLTSSDGKAPRQHLTLDYVVQPDGSRVAHDTLMLLRGSELATNGSVTLRDPTGETLVMRVVAGEAVFRPQPEPVLRVDQPALHLGKVNVGEEAYAILNIGQQFAQTPVSVVVDDPAQFSIATGVKQLLFGPSLLFTPAPTGTYIHVRYQPDRPGRHSAHLYIETPYQTKQVRLTGRTTGLVAPVLSRQPTQPREPAQRLLPPAPTETTRRRGRLGLPALLLLGLGGLAFAGYAYRCELAPSLCRQSVTTPAPLPVDVESATEQSTPETETTESAAPSVNQRSAEPVPSNAQRPVRERPTDEPADAPVTRRTQPNETEPNRTGSRQTGSGGRANRTAESEPTVLARSRPQPEPEAPRVDNRRRSVAPTAELPTAVERSDKRRVNPPVPTSEESDLEQELNKKPGGNRR